MYTQWKSEHERVVSMKKKKRNFILSLRSEQTEDLEIHRVSDGNIDFVICEKEIRKMNENREGRASLEFVRPVGELLHQRFQLLRRKIR